MTSEAFEQYSKKQFDNLVRELHASNDREERQEILQQLNILIQVKNLFQETSTGS